MAEDKRRLITGSIMRGQVRRLRALGHLDAVFQRVSPETQALIVKPPLSLSKVHAGPTDEIAQAVIDLHGRAAARDLSYHVNRENTGPMVVPLVKSLLAMFGQTPHAVFGNLASISAAMTRNIDFGYEKRGPANGAVILHHDEPAGPGWFVGWEGVLLLGLELASVTGEVWPYEPEPDGRGATFRVRWDEAKKAG